MYEEYAGKYGNRFLELLNFLQYNAQGLTLTQDRIDAAIALMRFEQEQAQTSPLKVFDMSNEPPFSYLDDGIVLSCFFCGAGLTPEDPCTCGQ